MQILKRTLRVGNLYLDSVLVYKFCEVMRDSDLVSSRGSTPERIAVVSPGLKGDVTRDDSQRRFLAQHSVATLYRHCFE